MSRTSLESALRRLDGRPYPAYRDLEGCWDLGGQLLFLDRAQGDPFAAPSRLRLRLPIELPRRMFEERDAREAAEDWLLRRVGSRLRGRRRGSGRSGQLSIYRPGPEVVERSALRLRGEGEVELRFRAGLPARGRRIRGGEAARMLLDDLPAAVADLGLCAALEEHVDSVCAQRRMRRALAEWGLVGFIADGSILPRASGVSQEPLAGAVPMQAPEALAVQLPGAAGALRGLGIREGITLITGGGFHGKSTLLSALQTGHLDFVPGDGRERVVARPDAVKVRAEDGRRVWGVDISPFLDGLPGGHSTRPLCTADASGSTSQAAAIVEAAEAGAGVLLIDEDTSATNLLVRDARMRQLIPREAEPITPLVERVRQLHTEWGLSTVMVVGGVGAFLAVADQVIGMRAYVPVDLSDRARELAGPAPSPPGALPGLQARVPGREGLDPAGRRGRPRVRARDVRALEYGEQEVDLRSVEQMLDAAHAASIGHAMGFAHQHLVDGRRHLGQVLDALDSILDDEGLDALSPYEHPVGRLVRPRRHEVAAALSRLRSLQVAGAGSD